MSLKDGIDKNKSTIKKSYIILAIALVIFILAITLILLLRKRDYQYVFIISAALASSAWGIFSFYVITMYIIPNKHFIKFVKDYDNYESTYIEAHIRKTGYYETRHGVRCSVLYYQTDEVARTKAYLPIYSSIDIDALEEKEYELEIRNGILYSLEETNHA